jgi:type VI secretion system protein VasD
MISALIASLAVAVSGCSDITAGVTKGVLDKMFEPGATIVEASFETSEFVNPDPKNRASPIIVVFYELSSVGNFESADFFALYEQDEEVLGKDLQARDEIQLIPGEMRSIERELKDETRYVAVIAAYRDIENANWRSSIEVELNETTPVVVKLEKLTVSMEIKKD